MSKAESVMPKKLYISVSPGETRTALRNGDQLYALELERHAAPSIIGNIYLGRVQNVTNGLQAAFVDIGCDRPAFLALPEARPANLSPEKSDRIGDYLKEGDDVIVQILRDSIAEKGPKLTSHINLPGRFVVFLPGDEGFIIGTAAESASDEQILQEIATLKEHWGHIEKSIKDRKPPFCLLKDEPAMIKLIRNHADHRLSEIIIDDPVKCSEVRTYCEMNFPQLIDSISLHTKHASLFDYHGIEDEIEAALSATIELTNGATLTIEETAALTAIDIDMAKHSSSGRFEDNAFEANTSAIEEIVRQIRLRKIGGHIVIDVIPMKKPANRDRLLSTLRSLFQDDPVRTFIAGYTRLGKIEFSRERKQKSLSELLLAGITTRDPIQRPKSSTAIAFEALRRVLQELKANPGESFELQAHPSIVASLQSGVAEQGLQEFNDMNGEPLTLIKRPDFFIDQFEVVPKSRT
jgi:ribonuclease G